MYILLAKSLNAFTDEGLTVEISLVTPAAVATALKLMGLFSRSKSVMAWSTRWRVCSARIWHEYQSSRVAFMSFTHC